MLDLRLRSCHLHGGFVAKDNKRPPVTVKDAIEDPKRDVSRVVLPPSSFAHEQEKVNDRWPAAVKFIKERGLNEVISADAEVNDIGIILQGGLYNTLNRSLELLGCSDAFGRADVPLYVMNVTYPVVDDEILDFVKDKRAVLLVEEGQPDFIEQNLNTILRRAGSDVALHGKGMLPVAGEYTSTAMTRGIAEFLRMYQPDLITREPALLLDDADPASPFASPVAAEAVLPRPPGLCTGCPERPIFSGLKLAERETGKHHVSADIGCHLFAINAPFDLGATTMGYGLGSAGAAALNSKDADRRTVAVMGDGGFWHNGLTSRRRQRGLQRERPGAGRRRQRLRGGHRRPGPPLLARRKARSARPSIRSRKRPAGSGSSGRGRSTTPTRSATSRRPSWRPSPPRRKARRSSSCRASAS